MIIGLAGYKETGKSEVARLLGDHGFVRQRFAQPLKDMLKAIGLTDDHVDGHLKEQPCDLLGGQTPRHAMQMLGSEWGRHRIHPDLWTMLWSARVGALPLVVVDDVRFPNEVDIIHGKGGVVWRISRPGKGGGEHESESQIPTLPVDLDIDNSGTIEDLRRLVGRKVKTLLRCTA